MSRNRVNEGLGMAAIVLCALGLLLAAGAAFATAASGQFSGIDAMQRWLKGGVYIGSGATADTLNKITQSRGATATIDFASTSVGRVESSAITVTGAAAGDSCEVGANTTAGALKADFSCYVSAADQVKVRFIPKDYYLGTITQVGDAGTATVAASSKCVCVGQARGDVACSVSSTTLTSSGPTDEVINYFCAAPVDPASGAFEVRVFSNN